MVIASGGLGSIVESFESINVSLQSLFNREGSKKIIPKAGLRKSSPSLLCKTMGKAKKEGAMRMALQLWGYRGRGNGDMMIILKGGGIREHTSPNPPATK